MIEYWLSYNVDTGAIAWRGSGPVGAAAIQQLPDGLATLVVPQAAIAEADINLDVIRDMLRARVDAEAGAFRLRFITDVPGQAQTYERKEREARSWTSGDETAHPGNYPFMLAEAAVRAVPIAQVQTAIMAQVDALTPLAAAIEAHRTASKIAISEAPGLLGIISAGTVDWQALLS